MKHMPDETRPNLEPLDEGELNFQEKVNGKMDSLADFKVSPEKVKTPEQSVERKEGQLEDDDSYAKILSQVTTHAPVVQDEVPQDAHVISKEQDAVNKIKNLVNLAQMKGIPHAVKVARHLEDNYLLDEFHDRLLSEELHNALVQKGLIKEI
jgi:hypothetical protein